MKIEQIKTGDLIPYAKNSRLHSEIQVSQIAGSIREFGFTNPVLIDAENGIIAGHGRVMAAQVLSLEKVPCIRLGHLTETQRRAYIIADNKLALNSGWDEQMLGLELADLRELDFDLNLTGFDGEEIERMLNPPEVDEEEIETTSDDSNKGDSGAYLIIGEFKIPLDADEFNAVRSLVNNYAEETGTIFGFGNYLVRKVGKQ